MRIRRIPSGFTLIELLVVVAILVILIAILVPSLEKAVAVANKAACLTNLKAFSVANRLYSQEHQGNVVLIYGANLGDGTRRDWQHRLGPYMGYPSYGKAGTTDGSPKFMLCPETQVSDAGASAQRTWVWNTGYGSYGFNLWLTRYPDYDPEPANFPPSYYYLKFDSAPGQTPILGEGIWIGGWPGDQDVDPSNYETGNGAHGTGFFMGRFCIDRHGGFTTNMAFVDGSAKNMILGELWNATWHRKFNPHYKEGGWD